MNQLMRQLFLASIILTPFVRKATFHISFSSEIEFLMIPAIVVLCILSCSKLIDRFLVVHINVYQSSHIQIFFAY